MENIIQIIIIGLFIIGSIIGINHVRVSFFTKKERYRDSVGSSRTQNEMIGRRPKK